MKLLLLKMNLWELKTYLYFYILILSFFISGLVLNCIQTLLYIVLRPWSKYYYRKINYYITYSFNSHMIFICEWHSKSDLYVHINSSDYQKYFGKEHAFIISNHRYESDWLVLGCICDKVRCAGNFKPYIKKPILYLPAFGWMLFFAESLFLQRNFEKDKNIIEKQIREIVDYPDPIWLILYPEGTRFTPKKHEVSLKFASEKGLPQLKFHLTPRTKGFFTSLAPMSNKMGAVYDVTVVSNTKNYAEPTLVSLLLGKKSEIHFYIKRIPFEEVPHDEEEVNKFMMDVFERKDKLVGSFFKTGDFFAESGIEKVPSFKIKPRYSTLINTIFWQVVINIPIFFYTVKLLLSGNLLSFAVTLGGISICAYFFKKIVDLGQMNLRYAVEKEVIYIMNIFLYYCDKKK